MDDEKLEVNKVTECQQKFDNKQSYEKKYIWASVNTKTIHMSLFPQKIKRHREASLTDITTIDLGAPKFYNDAEVRKSDLNTKCLTIKFKRGGGIDLMFETEAKRDVW